MQSSDNITIYRPNMRHDLGLFQTWIVMSNNVWASRELIWQLFKRDFLAAYKKSFIGITWILIAPLAGILSWVFLQATGMLRPGDVGIPYPAYVLVGTSMFGLFMKMYYAASGTLNSGKDLIHQVNYPHEALLFKQMGQVLADFLITFAMIVIVLVCFRVIPSPWLVLFPLVALPLIFFSAALGLMICMIGVVAVDISRMWEMGIAFLMYATPIIYASTIEHGFVQTVIKWNPLSYLVCSCRDIIIYGRLYQPVGYVISSVLSLCLFLIVWRLFYVSEYRLVERMV